MIGDSNRFHKPLKPKCEAGWIFWTNTVNRSNQKWQQLYADNTSSKQKRVDGSNYNKEVGAKKPRAAQVYGSRKKAP